MAEFDSLVDGAAGEEERAASSAAPASRAGGAARKRKAKAWKPAIRTRTSKMGLTKLDESWGPYLFVGFLAGFALLQIVLKALGVYDGVVEAR